MANPNFSQEYERLINRIIISADQDHSDDDIVNDIISHAGYSEATSKEVHSKSEILNQVKLHRAYRRDAKSQPEVIETTAWPPPPRDPLEPSVKPKGFNKWKMSWDELKSTASATAKGFWSQATSSSSSWSGAARSAWNATIFGTGTGSSGPGSASAGGFGGHGGRGPGSGGAPPGGSPYGASPGISPPGGGSGGGGNWWSSGQWGGAGGSRGGPPGPPGPSGWWNRSFGGGSFVESIYAQEFLPRPHSFFGKVGAAAGAKFGHDTGAGTVGSQVIGTVIGNFVGSIKEAVTQAHAFAVQLKDANRHLIYYNSNIAMSYVQSDIIAMFREMRISRAVAPSTISLNRAITAYEALTTPREIFDRNLQNDWAQVKLGISYGWEEAKKPFYEAYNTARNYVDPSGDLPGRLARFASRVGIGIAATALAGPIGIPVLAYQLYNAIRGFNDQVVPGGGVSPWEDFFRNPRSVAPTTGVFHQRGGDRFGFPGGR